MDHRAVQQASALTQTKHSILSSTGGAISPEMSIAKVLWLYQKSKIWSRIGHLFELPDYLTWRATQSTTRSVCSLVCKWCYGPRDSMKEILMAAGVAADDMLDLLEKCGVDQHQSSFTGSKVGLLGAEAATAFGLEPGIPIASGVIDAYAGAIATLALGKEILLPDHVGSRMALIGGTSSCHIVLNSQAKSIPGVWGPYPNVILPKFVCFEAGQSLTGKAIDTILAHHPLFAAFKDLCEKNNDNMFTLLNEAVVQLAKDRHVNHPALLTTHFHVYPDLHGNRSPLADPLLRGMMVGLQVPLKSPTKLPSPTLVLFYYSTLLGLCYGTRHIIERLEEQGVQANEIVLSGGLANNTLWAQSLADVTGKPVLMGLCPPDQTTLLGSAICGASAYKNSLGETDQLWDCMLEMSNLEQTFTPQQDANVTSFHAKKYKVYRKMIQDQYDYRQMMNA